MNPSQIPKIDNVVECVVPGCSRPGNTQDHVLFHQQKNAPKVVRDWLHKDYNIQNVCIVCNIDRSANTEEQRERHVAMWMEKDPDGFQTWLAECPPKMVISGRWNEIRLMILEVQ